MKLRLATLAISLAALGTLLVTSLPAHHSLAAEFDQSTTVDFTGTITNIEWTNPHAWIYVDVEAEDGSIEKWQCELGSPNAMTRAGFGPASVKPGDKVTFNGYIAKDGSNTISTRVVTGLDGRVLLSQRASPPPGAGKGKGK